MSREKEAGAMLKKCAPRHQYTMKEIYIYICDRRSERGEERIPECERRQCDEYERVQFSPMAIFDKMVMKKGNIAVTMGLIR